MEKDLMHAVRPAEEINVVALVKARALLVILLTASEQTLLALDASSNVLDPDLTEDLRRMIDRTQRELSAMDAKLDAFGS